MDLSVAPRSNRDPETIKTKLARLNEPHIAPITRLVEEIRALRGQAGMPYVDPTLGGVNAQVLFLFAIATRRAEAERHVRCDWSPTATSQLAAGDGAAYQHVHSHNVLSAAVLSELRMRAGALHRIDVRKPRWRTGLDR